MPQDLWYKPKLIEVALPLEDINRESVREKSIGQGHRSTMHLWWARRPLAACRATLFAQLVDDPSAHPDKFPTEAEQETERKRLHRIISRMVAWENIHDENLIREAQEEILKSTGGTPPPILDPFAGGGSIPLEAQRLGLEAHASDLNPVAVLINKAMIEIPPRFAGQPPVNPEARGKLDLKGGWRGAAGLADDVRYYGAWMRQQALQRIGHLYPQATLPDGGKSTVIAWLWARTVESPNPAFRGCQVPLVSSFWLSTKPGKETWVEPIVEGKSYRFEVRTGKAADKAVVDAGTKLGRGANFRCLLSNSPIAPDYIRKEAQAGRMGTRLMAIVAEGDRGRLYLPPTEDHAIIAKKAVPKWKPDQLVTTPCHDVDRLPMYGMYTWGDAFTPRQLVALTTFSDLVQESRERVKQDALAAGMDDDGLGLDADGTDATAYADAVAVYLAFGLDKETESLSTLCTWSASPKNELVVSTFRRQALPMTWDFGEANPFAVSSGSLAKNTEAISRVIGLALTGSVPGGAQQRDAAGSVGLAA